MRKCDNKRLGHSTSRDRVLKIEVIGVAGHGEVAREIVESTALAFKFGRPQPQRRGRDGGGTRALTKLPTYVRSLNVKPELWAFRVLFSAASKVSRTLPCHGSRPVPCSVQAIPTTVRSTGPGAAAIAGTGEAAVAAFETCAQARQQGCVFLQATLMGRCMPSTDAVAAVRAEENYPDRHNLWHCSGAHVASLWCPAR